MWLQKLLVEVMACLLAIINHEFLKCYYVEVMSILTVINERCHLHVCVHRDCYKEDKYIVQSNSHNILGN
jgi:hypothetical protein